MEEDDPAEYYLLWSKFNETEAPAHYYPKSKRESAIRHFLMNCTISHSFSNLPDAIMHGLTIDENEDEYQYYSDNFVYENQASAQLNSWAYPQGTQEAPAELKGKEVVWYYRLFEDGEYHYMCSSLKDFREYLGLDVDTITIET